MIDLSDVRARLRTITTIPDTGSFLTVSDWASATDAIEQGNGLAPACYVSLSKEKPQANRLASGGRAQRIVSVISALFCLAAERADEERSDPIEITRGSIIGCLVGYKAAGALDAFSYDGYSLRAQGAGFVWGEVTVAASWDLRTP